MTYVKKIEDGKIVWGATPTKGDQIVVVRDEAGKREISQPVEHDGAMFSEICEDAVNNATFTEYTETKTAAKSRFA